TIAKGDRAFPLGKEFIIRETAAQSAQPDADSQRRTSPAQRWKKLKDVDDVVIFENTRVLPRAWLASEAQALTEPETLQVIRTGKLPDGRPWEPRRVALIEGAIDFKPNSTDDAASAAVTTHEPNRVTVNTQSTAPSILVLSENHYPGWRAYVDGRLVETLRVDYNLRGVSLQAGEHGVEFVYRPKSVVLGLVISLLTLMAMGIWWKGGLRQER
ncbi:MAG: YfhO family protein, partial [Pyrinomonadaceae bacterium]